jgi:hypothetical protein
VTLVDISTQVLYNENRFTIKGRRAGKLTSNPRSIAGCVGQHYAQHLVTANPPNFDFTLAIPYFRRITIHFVFGRILPWQGAISDLIIKQLNARASTCYSVRYTGLGAFPVG